MVQLLTKKIVGAKNELDRVMKITDEVLKHMIVREDEE